MHSELRGISSSIARESKQRNMRRTPTCAKLKKHNNNLLLCQLVEQVERELTRKDSARRRKQRSRAVASAQAAQSTTTMDKEPDAASTTPRDAINTNVLQEPYVEHQAEGTSCGFRSNLNANDNNDSHSHQQPGAQPNDSQPPHPELVELHQCKASIITMNAMRLEPLKRMRVSMRNSILPKQTPVQISGNSG